MTSSEISFNTLPHKAQRTIFQNFTQCERQVFRIVCLQWNRMIVEHFPVELAITNDNYERLFHCPNARRASINNFTAEFSQKIGFGNSLCDLEISGKVLTPNLIRILHSCPNLESLGFSSLKQVLGIESSEVIRLPKVRTLEIKVRPDQETFTSDEFIIINTLRNIKFGALEAITISVRNISEWDYEDEDDATSLPSEGLTLDQSMNDIEIPMTYDESEVTTVHVQQLPINPSLESQDNPNILNLPDQQLTNANDALPNDQGQPENIINTGPRLDTHVAVVLEIPSDSHVSSISQRPIVADASAGNDSMSDNSTFSRPGMSENEFAGRLFTARLQMQVTDSGADLDTILGGSYSASEMRSGQRFIANQNPSNLKKTVFFELIRNNGQSLKKFIVKARPDFICFGNISSFSNEMQKIQFEEVEYSFGRSQLCLEFMLLQAQSKLVKIKLHILDDMWKYLMVAVERSQETLTEIDMKILSLNEDPIDVAAFSKCKTLKMMKLFHFFEKSSISLIPTSLTKFVINGPLSTEDMQSFTTRLINLIDFTLILNTTGGRIDLNLFKKFVSMPKIAKLLFIQSLLDVDDISNYCNDTPGLAASVQGPKNINEPYSLNTSIQYVAVTVASTFLRNQVTNDLKSLTI